MYFYNPLVSRPYIFILLLFAPFTYGQSGTFDSFKNEISSLSADSIFLMIDDKLAVLNATNAGDQTISELLLLKVRMADSLENRFMKYYAYQAMIEHSSHLNARETFDLLTRKAKIQSKLGFSDEAMVTYFEAAHFADSVQKRYAIRNCL